MALDLDTVRRHALALPGTTEAPHHDFGSFRVGGRIFVTLPPGGEHVHILLPEAERELALAMDAEFLEPLRWGAKVLGVRVTLARATEDAVLALVTQAHAARADPPRRTARRPRR